MCAPPGALLEDIFFLVLPRIEYLIRCRRIAPEAGRHKVLYAIISILVIWHNVINGRGYFFVAVIAEYAISGDKGRPMLPVFEVLTSLSHSETPSVMVSVLSRHATRDVKPITESV